MNELTDNTEAHDLDPEDAIETLEGTEIDEATVPNQENPEDYPEGYRDTTREGQGE